MSYSLLYVDDIHLQARQNFITCITILDEIVGEDINNIILSYHYYNWYIDNIKIFIPHEDYKMLLKFAYHQRKYNKHKKVLLKILSTILPHKLINNILDFYEFPRCLTYEYRISGCYRCNCTSL